MLLSTLSIVAALMFPDAPDTLKAVTVVADRGVVISRTDTVRTSNHVSIADALAQVPGVYVSDCGGMAGLKTVSIRGMGSPHAAVYIDGVRAGNVQSGQTDLGMLDPLNCVSAVIDYAQNSLSYNTAKPVFGKRPVGGNMRIRGGSFGTFEPSARMDFRLSDKVSLSAMAGLVASNGDFPLDDGSRRLNNDIRQVRSGVDSWGRIKGGDWHAKMYYNCAERGTPGTLAWPSSDRQEDRNAFVQGLLHKQFTPLYMLIFSAKASRDDMMYRSEWGDNRYRQTEAQLNSSHKFSVSGWFDFSFAADLQWDGLASDLYSAERTSIFSTASAAFHPGRFSADLALEYTGTFDKDGEKRNVLSPSVDLNWKAFEGFSLRAFARRAYRTPTFNELYYPGFGNPALNSEDAWLTDLGVEYNRKDASGWLVRVKADAFYNSLKDKIISVPSEADPNIWLPYNIGSVRMAGTDIHLNAGYDNGKLKSVLSARYSFQDAVDRTLGSDAYGRQVPFVSKHTVCAGAEAAYRHWNCLVNWLWHGGRYDSAGTLPDYSTLDITLSKDVSIEEDLVLGLKLMARNICDCRYELAGGYPMPGRSFHCEIDFKF